MSVAPGTRLGPYEILAKVGAGGMGEVYRARDTRLDRTVAVKVLPADRLDDAQARQRFDREARTVAALNHQHICHLHDVGHQDGVDYLVMEFLEGETLAARLSRSGTARSTGLPIEEVLRHAVQIAEALSEAHRHGIVHRDLKPGNIILTPSGVKLLDFGLAKLQPSVGAAAYPATLTVTRENPLSTEGSILGTWPYMAPEQLEGRAVDSRTDIFAFGSVLYEMVTGRRAFEGDSQASLIAAILERDPDPVSSQQPLAPAALERVVRKCLAKQPDARWQSASDLADALRWIDEERKTSSGIAAVPATQLRRWGGPWPWAATVVAVTAAVAGWQAARTVETTPIAVVRRFVLTLPANAQMLGSTVALSPDGTRVVYTGGSPQERRLFSRRFDSFDVEPIAGTENARQPFFSFDGQSIGFHSGPRILRMPSSGGTPRLVADTGPTSHGTIWTRNDQILFSGISVPISSVPANGGSIAVVVPIDEANNEIDQHGVVQLPSGALLYGSHTGSNVFHVIARLPDGERRILIRNAFTPKYLPTGQLVFARGESLRVVDFDPARLAIGGTEVTVVEGVLTFPESGTAYYSVSNNGTLAYVPAPSRRGRTLMWLDRAGRAEPVGAPPREYLFPSLSPDGTALAVQVTEDDGDHIWLHRINDGSSSRLVLQGSNSRPQWTPDSRAIVVGSARGEERLLVRHSVDAGTPEQILARGINATFWPGWWTPDGATLLYIENPPTDISRIRRLQMARGAIETLPLGTGAQDAPSLSPDGRWLAYASDQSGRTEVYVRAVSGDGVARQITTEGAGAPRWSRDGREIFFLSGRGGAQMTAVSVTLAPALQIGPPRVLFTVPFATASGLGPPPWDVTADGRRFVMVKASDEELQPSVIAIVDGWFEELKRVRGQ